MKIWRVIPVFFLMFGGQLSAIEGLNKLPYAGLVLDEVDVDGIEVSNFRFDNGKKHIKVKPGESFTAHLSYKVDAKDLKKFHLHHLIIGFYKDGPGECVLSSFGIIDAVGNAAINLEAPNKTGIYEIRASVGEGLTCERAKKEWRKNTSMRTVLGLVLVN